MSSLPKKIDLTAETTGSLPAARITGYPPVTGGTLTQVANAAARLAQTGLAAGDSTIQVDTGVLYLLVSLPEATAGNWVVWNPTIAGMIAANVVNTPAGGIAATDVQAALNELDTEKGTKIGIQNQSYVTAADTGAADAYVLVVSPAITSYVTGQRFSFKAVNANTGASTLDVSGLGVKSIKKDVSVAMAAGDILASQWVEVAYDGTNFQLVSKTAVNSQPYVKVSEVQTSGTNAGTFTLGAWRTRVLNTEDSDIQGICTLAANQITLTAGDYLCRITAPALGVDQNKARLYNTTGAATVLLGTSEYGSAAAAGSSRSVITGRFTIAAAQALEVQHYSLGSRSTDGFGTATIIATVNEVYTVAEFWKVG